MSPLSLFPFILLTFHFKSLKNHLWVISKVCISKHQNSFNLIILSLKQFMHSTYFHIIIFFWKQKRRAIQQMEWIEKRWIELLLDCMTGVEIQKTHSFNWNQNIPVIVNVNRVQKQKEIQKSSLKLFDPSLAKIINTINNVWFETLHR